MALQAFRKNPDGSSTPISESQFQAAVSSSDPNARRSVFKTSVPQQQFEGARVNRNVAKETGRTPFEAVGNTLTNDTSKLLGLTGQVAQSDPFSQRFSRRAQDTFARINPEALVPVEQQLRAQQNAGRFRALQSREAQQGALGQLQRIASGQDSVVDAQERFARDKLQRGIASQLASQRGSFNPAAQRQAFRALSQGQVDLGAQTAAAKAEERRAAIQALLSAQAQARQQDLGALGLEGQLSSQQANLLNAINQQRARFAGDVLGRTDSAEDRALRAAGVVAGVPLQAAGPGPLQSALGLAGAGAGIGGAIGGPVGAGIGGAITGGLGLLGSLF